MVSATDLANYVISKAYQSKTPINNLKLQKILYYIQGNYLAQFGKPLFYEEIEAWKYGPVVRDVYIKFVSNGALGLRPDSKTSMPSFTDKEKECVDNVLREKLNCSVSSLVRATQNEKPWKDYEYKVKQGMKPVIPKESIYSFFLELDND